MLRAIADAAELSIRWLPTIHLAASAAGLAWLIQHGRRWWMGAPTAHAHQLTRLTQLATAALVVAVIAHLLTAEAARSDANGGLANRLFGRRSDQPMGAAAVATLAHLLIALAPACILARRLRV
jgi:hypothetical protein